VLISCLSAWVALLAYMQVYQRRSDGEDRCVFDITAWGVEFPAEDAQGVRIDAASGHDISHGGARDEDVAKIVRGDVGTRRWDEEKGMMTQVTAPHLWQEEDEVEEEAIRMRRKTTDLIQNSMLQIVRLCTPSAPGSVHALGWLALASNVFDLTDWPMFKVAPGLTMQIGITAAGVRKAEGRGW
jgi:hypothetical protein